ncbi:MAG: MFS transporter [Acidovorax sp.]
MTAASGDSAGPHPLFPVALGLLVALDYFDNGAFSFFASYIAGGLNAPPDELVWATSAYAVASVLGILQQQWWIERVGHRRYLVACPLLFSMAGLAAMFAESSVEMAFARAFQGYFMGPMLCACRIIIQVSFSGPSRSIATRIFLTNILLASATAPLLGAYLVAHAGWQALFAATALAGFGLAGFASVAIPETGRQEEAVQGEAHFWAYIVFAAGIGMLQIAMQQIRFQLFTGSPQLIVLSACGLGALAWFARHQWSQPHPLVKFQAIKEKPFQTGLILYTFFYYISNALGYLVSRLLEGGLGYPVENTGNLVGFSALAALPLVFLYFKYSPLIGNKKFLMIPGYMITILVCFWLSRLPPDVSTSWLIGPMFLRGALLLTMALPVGAAAFGMFSDEEYHHGYRFKGILKQLTYSFSTATIIMLEQHRGALHYAQLAEAVTPSNPSVQPLLDSMTGSFMATGHSLAEAHSLALFNIYEMVVKQANLLSVQDGFIYLGAIAVVAGLFTTWQRHI